MPPNGFPEHDEVPESEDKNVVERINKADMTPLFDGNHQHIYTIDEEETDEYQAYKCSVQHCEIGMLIRKV